MKQKGPVNDWRGLFYGMVGKIALVLFADSVVNGLLYLVIVYSLFHVI